MFYSSQEWGTSARAHVQMYPIHSWGTSVHRLFLYLGKGWMNHAEIRHVSKDLLALHFTQVMDKVHTHMRTCASVFHISKINGPSALKFDVL